MSTYAWPQTAGWIPDRFEMRIVPNVFTFTSQYNKSTQAVDMLGERWRVLMDLPADTSALLGAAREAFFDRLKGPLNSISLGHQKLQVPQGTLRDSTAATGWIKSGGGAAGWIDSSTFASTWRIGAPALLYAIAQLGNIATIQTEAYMTLRAGDLIGLGSGGQLVRAMADATADANGWLTVEFMPRARAAIPAYTAVIWNYPTALFRLVSDGIPTSWRPGVLDGASLELIEVT